MVHLLSYSLPIFADMKWNPIIKSDYKPKNIAVKLTNKGENYLAKSHPWIFSKTIEKLSKPAKTGDLAIVFHKKSNKMIGIGIYDADSPIRIKVIHSSSEKVTINESFFNKKIELAYQKRTSLLATNTNSYRLIFGENDEFPSLIADVYAKVLVVKLYSEIWIPYLEAILKLLQKRTDADTVVLRLSRNVEKSNKHQLEDGMVVYGILENNTVEFIEHGIHFSANVIEGHKTGYFLDHRDNRRRVGELSKGKKVLDVFSYAGGFSVHALANGAKEVTSVDISKQALDIAFLNGKLNPYTGKHKTIAGDAFQILEELITQNKRFDMVVIDPPSFAKKTSEVTLAKKKYRQLAKLGLQLTSKKGTLVLASCSSRVVADAFFEINQQTLNTSGRNYKTVLKTYHDTDHPIGFPEGAYLKCGYYEFMD